MLAEIPFASMNRGFLAFSPNVKNVLLQGDDYYFKVYHLDENKFIHLAGDQYNTILRIEYYGSGMAGLVSYSSLLLIDEKTYEPIAYIDRGKTYDPRSEKIYAQTRDEIITFPYLSYPELLNELENSFPGESLSAEERMKYHVD